MLSQDTHIVIGCMLTVLHIHLVAKQIKQSFESHFGQGSIHDLFRNSHGPQITAPSVYSTKNLRCKSYLVHLLQRFPVSLWIQQQQGHGRDQIRGHKKKVKAPSNAGHGNWCDLVEQDLRQPIGRTGD